MSEKPTLVIGDCHGNLGRFENLLIQEGIVGPCGACAGSGDVSEDGGAIFCPACKGNGLTRINHDVTVVQLGDLGDFRYETMAADSMLFNFADQWIDVMLWGNHERPVVDRSASFSGYCQPLPETLHRIKLMQHEQKLRLAYAAHGFLLTHAGLPPAANDTPIAECPNAEAMAVWLNAMDQRSLTSDRGDTEMLKFHRIRDSVGFDRGGWNNYGGLFWRDTREKLYQGVRQVFGHSSHEHVCQFDTKDGVSYDVDLSKHGGIAAIWLPNERVVELKDEEPSFAEAPSGIHDLSDYGEV